MTDLRPLSTYYLVRLVDPAEKSAGGIWLPETARVNFTEAKVLAVGPGWDFGKGLRVPMQAAVGERVLFLPHDLTKRNDTEGFVKDEDLVAIHGEDGTVWPVNDWVRLTPQKPETLSEGGIVLSDYAQKREKYGRIEAEGPGRLVKRGKLKGWRCSILSGYWKHPWVGAEAWWDDRATTLDLSSDEEACVLVRAEDLIAVYEEENSGLQGDGEEARP